MNSGASKRISLQPRDLEFLRGLFESRVMTLAHATALYFGRKKEMAKKRVQRLKGAALVRERPRRAYEPSVLFLTAQAFRHLSEHGHLADYPNIGITSLEKRAQVSELTLRHELDVMDVKTAFVAAVEANPALQVAEFSTWPLLTQFLARCPSDSQHGRHESLLKPDGLIRLRETDAEGTFEHSFFVEVDRSTESQSTLATKAACYIDHYRSGGFAERQGGERSQYQAYPFRVLMLFRNAERRNNAAEAMLSCDPPIYTQVWLAQTSDFIADPLGPVWIRPSDYRDAIKGTGFSPAPRTGGTYRRQIGREEFVEQRIAKHSLVAESLDSATTQQHD